MELDVKHTCTVSNPQHPDFDGDVRECMACGVRDCPYGEPLHYHHDGCPACDQPGLEPPPDPNPHRFKGVETGSLHKHQLRTVAAGGVPDDELEFSDDLICPYCGAEQRDLFEVSGAYEEGDHECHCGTCGGEFRFETSISYSYSMTKIRQEEANQ